MLRRCTLLLAVAAVLLAAVGSAMAAPPVQDLGVPAGPLNKVAIATDLSCQLQHTGDTRFEFFPASATPGDCGTFVSVDGTLYAPDFANHDGTATSSLGSFTPFTQVSQSPKSGDGSSGNPFKVVTVARAGEIEITQTDTYVAGQESYRTDVTIRNTGGAPHAGIVYRAGDCYLQDTDSGFGFQEPNTTAIGCSANANNNPPNRIEEWVPITPGNNFSENGFSTVWGQIGAQQPLPNTCAQCAQQVDNGAGISWGFNLVPGASATFSHFTTFSPTGRAGPPPPPTPPTPTVTGPAGNPLGLPPNRKCVDTRKFSFRLHHPAANRIVDVRAFINGKLKRHLRATSETSIERLTIKKLPQKRFKVKIVATQDSGNQLISVRKYKGCKKGRPRTRRGHRRGHR